MNFNNNFWHKISAFRAREWIDIWKRLERYIDTYMYLKSEKGGNGKFDLYDRKKSTFRGFATQAKNIDFLQMAYFLMCFVFIP